MGECISYPRLPNMAPVKQAAQLYGLSPYYIRRLCKAGKIRFVNAGRGWLWTALPGTSSRATLLRRGSVIVRPLSAECMLLCGKWW